MKVPLSGFLTGKKAFFQEVIKLLNRDFSNASILCTDCAGREYRLRKKNTSIEDSKLAEQGFVIRVTDISGPVEYSFNEISEVTPEQFAKSLKKKFAELVHQRQEHLETPDKKAESWTETWQSETEYLPEEVSEEDITGKLSAVMNHGLTLHPDLIDFPVYYVSGRVSKMFLSQQKTLEQSYVWSNAGISPTASRNGEVRWIYKALSGLCGTELLKDLSKESEKAVRDLIALFDAERVTPGVYDVICSPGVSGLIAHEAFGHGVETDMFLKKRARAEEYLGKMVASEKVFMKDGAASAVSVASYLFDDEGNRGQDTTVIEKGILKKGLSDELSACRLGIHATGNGRRESFERKAYARMTNTIFLPGVDNLEQMIASVKHGYLLDYDLGGMEDPRNWGIQCSCLYGKEIRDGQYTGKIVSPLMITGFVPDLLKNITMVSSDLEICGSGHCGKGYKEWVKVSAGGPYLKTRVRLG